MKNMGTRFLDTSFISSTKTTRRHQALHYSSSMMEKGVRHAKNCEEVMCLDLVANVAKNYNPNISLQYNKMTVFLVQKMNDVIF
jgi:isopentenyl diphosphate isomerase/L-lactate dehydrogenase-like FMN-dependent dehydrogenase